MAFVHGKQTKVIVDEFDMSGFLTNTDVTREIDTPETTTFGADERTYITGLRGGSMSFAGFWDSVSDGSDEVFNTALGQSGVVLVTYGPDGLTVGDKTISMQSRHTSYTPSSPIDGVVAITLDTQGDGRVVTGVSLHDLTSEVGSDNSATVDQAAATSAGAHAYLHVTAWNATTLDVKVEDSINDSDWTDLITFTQASGVTKERVTVSGNVDQYVRANWTLVGTSATFTLAFARL